MGGDGRSCCRNCCRGEAGTPRWRERERVSWGFWGGSVATKSGGCADRKAREIEMPWGDTAAGPVNLQKPRAWDHGGGQERASAWPRDLACAAMSSRRQPLRPTTEGPAGLNLGLLLRRGHPIPLRGCIRPWMSSRYRIPPRTDGRFRVCPTQAAVLLSDLSIGRNTGSPSFYIVPCSRPRGSGLQATLSQNSRFLQCFFRLLAFLG